MFLTNKYTTMYYQIINDARLRQPLDTYHENHHIIPKSLGGSNLSENLVELTAREHFICHWLLTKMVDSMHDKWKMINALGYMLWAENDNQERYKVNSRLYEKLKIRHSEMKSWAQIGERNGFYGKKHSAEAKETMSQKAKGREPWNKGKPFKGAGMTGKRHSEETKKKLSQAKKSFRHSEKSKKQVSDALKGIKRSAETKQKMRESKLGIQHPKKTCEYCNKNITVAMFARGHGLNCKNYFSS